MTGLRDGAPTGNVFDWTLAYDAADNVTNLLDHQNSLHTQTLSYDARSQVVGAVNGWGQNQTYTYDGNGNRISSAGWETGDASLTLSYVPGSNHLLSSVTGGSTPVTRAYAYDANGNEVQGSTGGYTSRLRTTTYGEDHRLRIPAHVGPAFRGMSVQYSGTCRSSWGSQLNG